MRFGSLSFSPILFHFLVLFALWAPLPTTCLYNDKKFDVRHHMATKTPYWRYSDAPYTPAPEQCRPVLMTLVARHGVRNPTEGDIDKLEALRLKIAAHADSLLTRESTRWMVEWAAVNRFPKHDQGFLVNSGELEHYWLAKRFVGNFSEVMSDTYTSGVYAIRSTQVSRSGTSANAFAFGMFEGKGEVGLSRYQPFFVSATSNGDDRLLRFFDNCPRYSRLVAAAKAEKKTASSASGDSDTDPKSPYSQLSKKLLGNVAKRVTERHFVNGGTSWQLDRSDVKAMWTACNFELAIHGIVDTWCALFTEEDANDFELLDDLSAYQIKAYYNDLNYQISCPLLNHFIDKMESIVQQPRNQSILKAELHFAHAETILPFVSLLGLFKDSEKLSAEMTREQLDRRVFRTSVISPFAANVAMVLYNCSSGHSHNDIDFRVKLLHNEVEHEFPGCNALYCPFERVKQLYAQYLKANGGCDFDTMCDVDQMISTNTVVAVSLGSSLATLLVGVVAGVVIAHTLLLRKLRSGYSSINDNNDKLRITKV